MKKCFLLSLHHSFLTSVSSFSIANFLELHGGRQEAAQILEIHLREEVPLFTIHIHTHNLVHYYKAEDQASSVERLDDL